MRPGETLIEMARRHVAEGEAHVRNQREMISWLRDKGLPLDSALELLRTFEGLLQDHRASLAHIEDEQRKGQRDACGNPRYPDSPL